MTHEERVQIELVINGLSTSLMCNEASPNLIKAAVSVLEGLIRTKSDPDVSIVHHYFPGFSFHGKWFAVNNHSKTMYLHKDGEWRISTFHNDQPTGWFDTREEIEALLDSQKA